MQLYCISNYSLKNARVALYCKRHNKPPKLILLWYMGKQSTVHLVYNITHRACS